MPTDADPGLPDDTEWHPVDRLPPTAFDHDSIVLAGRERLRAKLSYTNVGFALAPETFTISQLRDLYAAALGHDVSATNLQRVLLRRDVLEPTGDAGEPGPQRRTSRVALPLPQPRARDHRSVRRAAAAALMRLLAALVAALPVGHSVDGRAIVPVVLGTPGAAHRVLVVGCIHGNEPAGIAIVKRLIRAGAPAGTEIVAVTSVNPDGCRRGTRQNAHGVDLNRNFPSNWSRIGRKRLVPVGRTASALGAGVALCREAHRAAAARGDDLVPPARGLRARVGREHPDRTPVRASRRLSVPERRWPFGTASNWQNHRFPGTASFVVELPAGAVPTARVGVWVRAIREIARQGVVH